MVYDSEDDQEAKLVGEGPAIHHYGIEIDDRQDFIDKIEVNGGTLRSSPRFRRGEVPRQAPQAHRVGARSAFASGAKRKFASVLACKEEKSTPSTSSRTTSPSAVTSMTARSV